MKSVFGRDKKDVPLSDPSALAKFGKLELIARLVVEGFILGQHKSPYKGASVEFVEHRQYYPGDEIRHIDWRAYGKTGKYYVKEYEDETNLRCYMLVDGSGSMGYGQSTLTKFEYARTLAAALAHLLHSQRDAVGLVRFDTEVREQLPPSASARNLQQLIATLEAAETAGETSLGPVVESLSPTVKRRSLICLFSDCFDSIDSIRSMLKRLRHSRHEVVLFQIVTPEEEEFPFSKPTQFRSLERTGHNLLTDPHKMREHYLEQYGKFCEDVATACGSMAVEHVKIVTTEPYHLALGRWLDSRRR